MIPFPQEPQQSVDPPQPPAPPQSYQPIPHSRREASWWDRDAGGNYGSVQNSLGSLGDVINAVQRLMNFSAISEGSALPPVLSAGTRIESPTNFQISLQEEVEGGTRFILQWQTPNDMIRFQPRFRVYAYYGQVNVVWTTGQSAATPDQFGPAIVVSNVDQSPADVFIPNDIRRPIKFELEMRLGSGWLMVAEQRPSCTAIMQPIEYYFRRGVTANYAMTARDRVVRGDASGGAFDITLPSPTSVPFGRPCDLRNSGAANNITVRPFGSETIEGAATLTLTPGSQAILYTDNVNWWR